MTDGNDSRPARAGEALEITRIFDASPERVFRAWTDPERVKCWWGPKAFTAPFAKIEPRTGGHYLYAMRSPDGQDIWSTGVYREVVEPGRIVATDSFSDAEGNVVPASDYGMPGNWPLELTVTVTFEADNGKTRMTLRHEGFPDAENRDMARAGWGESFDKLDECLAKTGSS